ncbi:MaoC family dehydratase N-terminal domain-containing protein [Janibacter sp. YIM B02568]|uniref:FAS1-like dehydratase domain-containing protein n=1 Tax=Janibacter endophyticus TaxID=2806261 RepID=UPI001951EDE1|nr:MaoC family dehydratase N-terminal domain-containing protein [Janibacter endophyticus]MBM6545422.1 MaoC family dehydratase N-terminal domain-containing protein [Janibacter endophyticus]
MTQSSTSSSPNAIVGRVVDTVAIDVEAGKIGEFVRATRVSDPVHSHPEAAAAAGLQGVAATPTHVVVAGHCRDPRAWVEALGLDMQRVIVGSVSWEYVRPLVAGDRVNGRRVVVRDERRDGRTGPMRVITMETDWRDASGDLAVRQRETIIERGTT